MYNGENHMVLPTYAPQTPDTINERVTVSILTYLTNIDLWTDYAKLITERNLVYNYITFEVVLDVECEYEEDWDDDRGIILSVSDDELLRCAAELVEFIDPDAELEII